ncbi:hypothetical protein ACN267_12290 [Micromonospora sp. WMMD734]|uniref:hypothetical protein n=1 Tax=Micromonospora sp. WMMD734 TaxID=3404129 RepID=UPI003B9325F0
MLGRAAHVLFSRIGTSGIFGATVDFENHVGDAADPNPPDQEVDEVFIANVRGGWYLVVPQGTAKPRAVVLGGDSVGSSVRWSTPAFAGSTAVKPGRRSPR